MTIRSSRPSARYTALVAAGALALLATGCGHKASSNNVGTKAVGTQSQDTSLNAMLPSKVKSAGVITVATDASYAPVESFGPDNKTIVGLDPDLGKALGQILGVKVVFTNQSFDGIIPALQAGRYDMAMSAMTDNTDREKVVDFVDYFSAGTSFMVKKSGNVTINTLDDLCGHKVAVEKGTTQLDDATAQSKKCKSAGKGSVDVQPYPDQNAANLALQTGRAEVVMADSPVNAYAAKQSNGQFQIVGQIYGTAPYGIAIPKSDTQLRDAVKAALQKLIDNGTYKSVLTNWGVEQGAVQTAQVNGAASS